MGVKSMAKKVRDTMYRWGGEERRPYALWHDGAPGAVGNEDADRPTYSLYLPRAERRTGRLVVVLPGGGYCGHAEHEAAPVGRWLRSLGVAAMVVRYRLAPRYRHPVMLHDAQQAVRLARANSDAWEISPNRIGILGFSAGGHLAAITAHLSSPGDPARPDFAVLIYPVIRMTGPLAHSGCRAALTGDATESALARGLNADELVSPSSPPCFIVHGSDDEVIHVGNTHAYAAACRAHGVPCEAHCFAVGPHGFGLARGAGAVAAWPRLCADWLARLD